MSNVWWMTAGCQELGGNCWQAAGVTVELLAMMERSCRGQETALKEEHLALVTAELQVLGTHPFRDVDVASTNECLTLCFARGKGKVRLSVISITMLGNITGWQNKDISGVKGKAAVAMSRSVPQWRIFCSDGNQTLRDEWQDFCSEICVRVSVQESHSVI